MTSFNYYDNSMIRFFVDFINKRYCYFGFGLESPPLRRPQSICPLFWYVVWGLVMIVINVIISIGVLFIALWLIVVLVTIIFSPLVYSMTGWYWSFSQNISLCEIQMAGLIAWIAIGSIALLISRQIINEKYIDLRCREPSIWIKPMTNRTNKSKAPGAISNFLVLIIEFLRAKKNKVCPRIEYY